jgi:hypothetical protein
MWGHHTRVLRRDQPEAPTSGIASGGEAGRRVSLAGIGRIAVTTDGHHVVAMFAASSEGTFRLVAVPIDDITSGNPS